MATVEFYSKTQVDAKVPDSSAASVGDVLTIGTGGVHEWAAGGGGGGGVTKTQITTATALKNFIKAMNPGDMISAGDIYLQDSSYDNYGLSNVSLVMCQIVSPDTQYEQIRLSVSGEFVGVTGVFSPSPACYLGYNTVSDDFTMYYVTSSFGLGNKSGLTIRGSPGINEVWGISFT